MRKSRNREKKFSLIDAGWISPCVLLLCLLWGVIFLPESLALASELKILTPPTASVVIGRNPETHLVLRLSRPGEEIKVKAEKTGAMLEPVVAMEGKKYLFQHFRLPLVSGMNRFTLVPGGQRIQITFKRLQAALTPKSLGENVYFFHQDEKLPKSCEDCHDLHETSNIDSIGLIKQTSCAACHSNLIDNYAWKHSLAVNQQCLDCHQKSVKPWRIGLPVGNIDSICVTCHISKKDWQTRKYPHGPMIGGCTLCHSPHGNKYRYLLWAEGSTELCIDCHSDKKDLVRGKKEERVKYVHGIIVGKGCVACHDPHATDDQFSLLKPVNELCVSCHIRLAGVNRGHPVERHPLSAPEEKRRKGRALTCVGCHDPHGSSYQNLLVETIQGGRLCRVCHNK